MVQRGEHLRFALEAGKPVGICASSSGRTLQRDIAIELRIARTEYLAHPADADAGDDS